MHTNTLALHPISPTFIIFSSPNRFSLRVQRTGCSRTVPLTSPPSVRVQWVIQLCRPLAHSNSTCIKRPAGFDGKILSLLADHAIFLGTIFSLSPRFRRLSHAPPEPKCRLHNFIVTLSTSSSSFHSQNRRENFSLCTTGTQNRLFVSAPSAGCLRFATFISRSPGSYRFSAIRKRKNGQIHVKLLFLERALRQKGDTPF